MARHDLEITTVSQITGFLPTLFMSVFHHPALQHFSEGNQGRYSCRPGLTLVGSSVRQCRQGVWQGETPTCIEMFCPRPQPPPHGWIQIVRQRETFSWGSRVVVLCEEGFVLSGNNTRQCVEAGLWTGPPPSCEPILCHHPPAVVNGLVQLLNGSTIWQASLAVMDRSQTFNIVIKHPGNLTCYGNQIT